MAYLLLQCLVTVTIFAEFIISGQSPQTHHNVACTIYLEDLMTWPNVLRNCSELNTILTAKVKGLISIGVDTSELGTLCIMCGPHRAHGTFYPSLDIEAVGRLITDHERAQKEGPNHLCIDGWMRSEHRRSTDATSSSARICITTEKLYYFGDKLQFLCHCQWEGCKDGSDCLKNNLTMCQKGWFGTKCQYRDLAQLSLNQVQLLTDNDDTTCLHVVPPQLAYTFQTPVFFTWLRVVHEQTVDHRLAVLSKTNIQLLQNNTLVECDGQREIHVDNQTVDIHCSGIRVTEVRLSWKDNTSLCSVHISGGRNVAMKQSTVAEDVDKPETAVDGNKGVISPCLHSNGSSLSWIVEFVKPKRVHEVVVYMSKDSTERHLLVKLVGLDDQDLYQQTYTGSGEPRHEIRLQMKAELFVLKIAVSSEDGPSSLSLCEVEAFGDCAAPYYGLDCGSVCSVRCLDQACDPGGRCLACDEDWEGDNCQAPAQQVQVESSRLCHCTACDSRDWCLPDADCIRGWFGEHCELKDLATESSMDETLLDNKESTCYTPGNNQVLAGFSKDVQFHWARLVFSSEVDHIDLKLFKTKNLDGPPSACERKRITVTSDSSMRVYTINCGIHRVVRAVSVRWNRKTTLCTFHMYGGSNLAVISNVKITNTSDEEFSMSGSSITDGLVSQHSGCLELDGDSNLFLSMSFPAEVTMFDVLLYSTRLNINDSSDTSSDSNILEVNSMDTREDVVDSKILAINHDGLITLTNFPHYGITRINLLMIKGRLGVCELEVFGECTPPAYGLRCEKTCSSSCYHRQCYEDGICWQCRDGVSGKACTEKDDFNAITMPKLIEHLVSAMPEAKKGSDVMNFIIACLIVVSCVWVMLFRYQNRGESKRSQS